VLWQGDVGALDCTALCPCGGECAPMSTWYIDGISLM
jgi:hypothetical protein